MSFTSHVNKSPDKADKSHNSNTRQKNYQFHVSISFVCDPSIIIIHISFRVIRNICCKDKTKNPNRQGIRKKNISIIVFRDYLETLKAHTSPDLFTIVNKERCCT